MIFFLLFAFLFPLNPPSNDISIIFEKIDNKVVVTCGNKVIYDSGLVDLNPEVGVNVTLPQHLLNNNMKLTVQVYNGMETLEDGVDKHWEIKYTIENDGMEVEYIWERADDYKGGLVFEKVYRIEDLY